MDDLNPYTAPADLAARMTPDETVSYLRDGDFLVVRDGAEMPEVCLLTNQPAGPGSWRKKVRITWAPPWVFALILINILVVLIVMLIIQKKAKITYSLCSAGREKITRRRNIGFVLLILGIGAMGYGFTSKGDPSWPAMVAGLLGIASFLTSLVMLVIANPIKVRKYKDGWFSIKGCSKDFLATLPHTQSSF